MKIEQVAVQLFTLRDHMTTLEDARTCLERVKAIGYQAVQVSGTPLPPAELKPIIDELGLVVCATHENAAGLMEDPQAAVERTLAWGASETCYPHPHKDINSMEAVKELAENLNKAGKLFRDAGLYLSYHNHAHEFAHVEGKPILEWIYELTDPQLFHAELDVFWVTRGGGNPVAWIEKVAGRTNLLHLKEFSIEYPSEIKMASIGDGNIDWPAVIEAGEKAGCKWFIVEQDRDWINDDAFEAVERSFKYLETLCS